VIVISNATPVISLSSVNQIGLLKSLFGKVIISEEVKSELLAKNRYGSRFPSLAWVEVLGIRNREFFEALAIELGTGEASVIALGKEVGSDFVIIDEKQGYNTAKYFGLSTIRTLSILEAAKKAGLIALLKPVVFEMVSKGGWYKRELIEKFLRDNGEEY
jgi:hypothetical protein